MPVLIGWSCTVADWSHHVNTMHADSIHHAISPLQSLGLAHALIGYGVLAAWQMQHFMTIAYTYQEGYEKAGFKMMQGQRSVTSNN